METIVILQILLQFRKKEGITIASTLGLSVNQILYSYLFKKLEPTLKKHNLRIDTIMMRNFPYLELKASKLINIDKEVIIFLDKVFRFYHWLSYKGLVREQLLFAKVSEKKYETVTKRKTKQK